MGEAPGGAQGHLPSAGRTVGASGVVRPARPRQRAGTHRRRGPGRCREPLAHRPRAPVPHAAGPGATTRRRAAPHAGRPARAPGACCGREPVRGRRRGARRRPHAATVPAGRPDLRGPLSPRCRRPAPAAPPAAPRKAPPRVRARRTPAPVPAHRPTRPGGSGSSVSRQPPASASRSDSRVTAVTTSPERVNAAQCAAAGPSAVSGAYVAAVPEDLRPTARAAAAPRASARPCRPRLRGGNRTGRRLSGSTSARYSPSVPW